LRLRLLAIWRNGGNMNERSEQQLMNVEVAMHVVEAMVASFLADTSALNESEQAILSDAWGAIKSKLETNR